MGIQRLNSLFQTQVAKFFSNSDQTGSGPGDELRDAVLLWASLLNRSGTPGLKFSETESEVRAAVGWGRKTSCHFSREYYTPYPQASVKRSQVVLPILALVLERGRENQGLFLASRRTHQTWPELMRT